MASAGLGKHAARWCSAISRQQLCPSIVPTMTSKGCTECAATRVQSTAQWEDQRVRGTADQQAAVRSPRACNAMNRGSRLRSHLYSCLLQALACTEPQNWVIFQILLGAYAVPGTETRIRGRVRSPPPCGGCARAPRCPSGCAAPAAGGCARRPAEGAGARAPGCPQRTPTCRT
jgi:hypothetical protein